MTFRPATLADIPQVVQLRSAFYAEEGYPDDPVRATQLLAQLVSDPRYGRLFVIEGEAYVLVTFGFSLEFDGRDAFVDELYVAPDARGRGYGTRALAIAEEACREHGVSAIHLEVELENEKARRLYERTGYEAHSRHLMTKWLTK
jgi:ribosomal protein S18 acetylase RimI-like enzyme